MLFSTLWCGLELIKLSLLLTSETWWPVESSSSREHHEVTNKMQSPLANANVLFGRTPHSAAHYAELSQEDLMEHSDDSTITLHCPSRLGYLPEHRDASSTSCSAFRLRGWATEHVAWIGTRGITVLFLCGWEALNLSISHEKPHIVVISDVRGNI